MEEKNCGTCEHLAPCHPEKGPPGRCLLCDNESLWEAKKQNPTPDYYNYQYKGIKFDPYRGADIYDITCPALFHAWKKIIRAGKDAKSYKQDIKEARDSLNRKLEMLDEDEY